MKIPLHSYDLIDELDRLYPEEIFKPGESKEAFLLRQGERKLVVWLKDLRHIEQTRGPLHVQ